MVLIKRQVSQLLMQCVRYYASGKNLCSVLHAANDLRFEERDIPQPKDDQVLVKLHTVGICGTDMHFYRNGAIGAFRINKPFVLGHEGAGTIVELGKNVKNFKVGDRIALEPGVSCRKCHYCKTGRYHLCANQNFSGLPPTSGLFTQYVAHDVDFCYKLPDNMTMDDGSLLEPLSVGIHGARKSGVKAGSKMLILGAGPVGLMTLLASKAFGATKVVVTDIADHRLDIAKEIGADLTINVANKKTDDIVKLLKDTLGELPDMAVECVGFPSSIELSIKGVKDGGCVVFIALAKEHVEIPIMDVVCREIDMHGAMKYSNTWPLAITLVSSGQINLDKLTRAHYSLDKIKEGFEKSKTGEVIKVFIKCNP